MNTKLILFGSGGHANSCIEIIKQYPSYRVIGYYDKKENLVFNQKYLGSEDNFIKNKTKSKFIIGFGSLDLLKNRNKIFKSFSNDYDFINLVSKYCYISDNVNLGKGIQIFNHVLINRNVTIGNNCIINSKSLIEHDVCITDNSIISTGVIINGNCLIESNTFIGSGTILFNNVKIGRNSIIGSGLTIRKDIPANSKILKNI